MQDEAKNTRGTARAAGRVYDTFTKHPAPKSNAIAPKMVVSRMPKQSKQTEKKNGHFWARKSECGTNGFKERGELRGLTLGGHGVVAGGVGDLGSTVSTYTTQAIVMVSGDIKGGKIRENLICKIKAQKDALRAGVKRWARGDSAPPSPPAPRAPLAAEATSKTATRKHAQPARDRLETGAARRPEPGVVAGLARGSCVRAPRAPAFAVGARHRPARAAEQRGRAKIGAEKPAAPQTAKKSASGVWRRAGLGRERAR